MANEPGRVRRVLIRVINDDNLDLYLLGAVALLFTVLGITGISDVKTTSAVVVALLALLAFSQIRSRRLMEQIRDTSRGGLNTLFVREYPADVVRRRAHSRDVLIIGHSLTRTVQGLRADLATILESGGRVRAMVLDPIDEPLMEAADRRLTQSLGPGALRARIATTLDELTGLRDRVGGRLEIRVSSSVLSAGLNCLDTTEPRGIVCVQHYEHQPAGEPAPIFTLEPTDGVWYQHFVAEAERLWEAGTDWPLSPAAAAARARRPEFSVDFGPELGSAMDSTSDLLVTGVARSIFVNNNFRRLEKKLLAGHRIRMLLVDPASPAIEMAADRYHPKRTAESHRERVEHALRLLAELKSTTDGDLSVRLTTYLISMFHIVTDSALFAEYYIYQDLGKPKFVLAAGGEDYRLFRTEAEKMWESATPHEM